MMSNYKIYLSQIHNCTSFLAKAGIAISVNYPVVVDTGLRRTVTWKSPVCERFSFEGVYFATMHEYRALLERQWFSALLLDGSLLQLEYDFDGESLRGHRLCYYPCPIDLDDELLNEGLPVLDIFELQLDGNPEIVQLRGPIRFDYDPKSISEVHPSTHVHLHRGDCRCLVSSPVSPGLFLRFVFKNFYSGIWSTHQAIRDLPVSPHLLSQGEDAIDLHFSYRTGEVRGRTPCSERS